MKDFRLTANQQNYERYLDSIHGPAPVCNFKQYRLSKDLSLQALANSTGLSKNALVRAEQGTYANPLPSLVQFWQRKLPGTSELDIVDAYEDYQFEQRKRYFHYFGLDLMHEIDADLNLHPFRQLRKHRSWQGNPLPVGVEQVSRDLCLPVDTLRFWEKKYASQKSVPKQVISVLCKIGYTQSDVQEFSRCYVQWREVFSKDLVEFSNE